MRLPPCQQPFGLFLTLALLEQALGLPQRVAWSQVQSFLPEDSSAYDDFGSSIAVSSTILAIGAYNRDRDFGYEYDDGEVEIYEYDENSTEFVFLQTLVESESDDYGEALAIDDDTLVVGARYSDSEGEFSTGSVFIYGKNSSGLWGLTQTIVPVDADSSDLSGESVAIEKSRLAFGSVGNEEKVYIYTKEDVSAEWKPEATLVSPIDTEDNDQFGYDVDFSGDSLVVGAPGEYDEAITGYAVIFQYNNETGWDDGFVIKGQGVGIGDRFGNVVAMEGDTVVVGDREYGVASACHIFRRDASGMNKWSLQQTFRVSSASVAISVDFVMCGETMICRDSATGLWEIADTLEAFEVSYGSPSSVMFSPDGVHAFVGYDDDVVAMFEATQIPFTGTNTTRSPSVTQAPIVSPATLMPTLVPELNGTAISPSCRVGFSEVQNLEPPASQNTYTYTDFGARVALTSSTVVVGAHDRDRSVGYEYDDGEVDIFVFDDGANKFTLLQTFAEAESDDFGEALAIHDDTLVVGARYSDVNGGYSTGSVFVYGKNSSGLWDRTQTIVPVDADSIDYTGESVAIEKSRLAFGSVGNEEKVYVYTKEDVSAEWKPEATLVSPIDTEDNDQFGYDVDLSGDSLVVGAPGEYDEVISGYAVIFQYNNETGWDGGFVVTGFDAGIRDEFGYATAIDGDTVVVANGESGVAGGCYIFRRESSGLNEWRFQQKVAVTARSVAIVDNLMMCGKTLLCQNEITGRWDIVDELSPVDFDYYSASDVAISPDKKRLAVGISDSVVALFDAQDQFWFEESLLLASDGKEDDRLGSSVAINKDVIVAGAIGVDGDDETQHGAVYIFQRREDGYGWTETQKLFVDSIPGELEVEDFGEATAVHGNTVVVGASRSNVEGILSNGAVFVFERRDPYSEFERTALLSGRRGGDWFGMSVAIDGDTIVVSDDADGGGVEVFTRSTDNAEWEFATRLTPPEVGDVTFDRQADISGDVVIVGFPNFGAGSAWVYERSERGTWDSGVALPTPDDLRSSDGFGTSLAIDGNVIAVGVESFPSDTQVIYVFERNDSGTPWTMTQKLPGRSDTGVAVSGLSILSNDQVVYRKNLNTGVWEQQDQMSSKNAEVPSVLGGVAMDGDIAIFGRWSYGSHPGAVTMFSFVQGPTPEPTTPEPTATFSPTSAPVVLTGDPTMFPTEFPTVTRDYIAECSRVQSIYQSCLGGLPLSESTVCISCTNGVLDESTTAGEFCSGFVACASCGVCKQSIEEWVDCALVPASTFTCADTVEPVLWKEQQVLLANDGMEDDRMGHSLAIDGNIIVAGAYGDDHEGESQHGSVYIYEREEGVWSEIQKILPENLPNELTVERFGFATAVQGNTLVVGATSTDIDSGVANGAVFIFERANATGDFEETTVFEGIDSLEYLGVSVALDGDTLAVADERGDTGGVYVYHRTSDDNGTHWDFNDRLAPSVSSSALFNRQVDVSGTTIVLGFPYNGTYATGSVVVYELSDDGVWEESIVLIPDDLDENDNFGLALAIDGNTIVVGTGGSFGVRQVGYVYEREDPESEWVLVQKLAGRSNAVDVLGSRIVLSGRVVYYKSEATGVWELEEQLRSELYNDRTVHDVAMTKDTILLGSWGDDTNRGAVHVFERNDSSNDTSYYNETFSSNSTGMSGNDTATPEDLSDLTMSPENTEEPSVDGTVNLVDSSMSPTTENTEEPSVDGTVNLVDSTMSPTTENTEEPSIVGTIEVTVAECPDEEAAYVDCLVTLTVTSATNCTDCAVEALNELGDLCECTSCGVCHTPLLAFVECLSDGLWSQTCDLVVETLSGSPEQEKNTLSPTQDATVNPTLPPTAMTAGDLAEGNNNDDTVKAFQKDVGNLRGGP